MKRTRDKLSLRQQLILKEMRDTNFSVRCPTTLKEELVTRWDKKGRPYGSFSSYVLASLILKSGVR